MEEQTKPKKVVFLNIVDGTETDYEILKRILMLNNKDYNFVMAPKQITSVKLEEVKKMFKEVDAQ